MGRKPFPIRGTNFSHERRKFASNRQQLRNDAAWWDPESRYNYDKVEARLERDDLDRRLFAEEMYKEALNEFVGSVRVSSVTGLSSVTWSYGVSTVKTKDDDSLVATYISKEDRIRVSVSRMSTASPFPDVLRVNGYGEEITVYRKEYLDFLDSSTEWERRVKYTSDNEVAKDEEYRDSNSVRIDPWKARLKLVLEAQ